MCLAAHRGLNTGGCFIEGINAGQRGEVALSSLKKTLASDQGELTKRLFHLFQAGYFSEVKYSGW